MKRSERYAINEMAMTDLEGIDVNGTPDSIAKQYVDNYKKRTAKEFTAQAAGALRKLLADNKNLEAIITAARKYGNVPEAKTKSTASTKKSEEDMLQLKKLKGIDTPKIKVVESSDDQVNKLLTEKIKGLFEIYKKDLGSFNWKESLTRLEKLGNGWRLPTMTELNQMFNHKANDSTFKHDWYWSSNQDSDKHAWSQNFSDGNQHKSFKTDTYIVRPVRDIAKSKKTNESLKDLIIKFSGVNELNEMAVADLEGIDVNGSPEAIAKQYIDNYKKRTAKEFTAQAAGALRKLLAGNKNLEAIITAARKYGNVPEAKTKEKRSDESNKKRSEEKAAKDEEMNSRIAGLAKEAKEFEKPLKEIYSTESLLDTMRKFSGLKVLEESSKKMAKCPTCGGKYLVQTGYCLHCKKKVGTKVKKEVAEDEGDQEAKASCSTDGKKKVKK